MKSLITALITITFSCNAQAQNDVSIYKYVSQTEPSTKSYLLKVNDRLIKLTYMENGIYVWYYDINYNKNNLSFKSCDYASHNNSHRNNLVLRTYDSAIKRAYISYLDKGEKIIEQDTLNNLRDGMSLKLLKHSHLSVRLDSSEMWWQFSAQDNVDTLFIDSASFYIFMNFPFRLKDNSIKYSPNLITAKNPDDILLKYEKTTISKTELLVLIDGILSKPIASRLKNELSILESSATSTN